MLPKNLSLSSLPIIGFHISRNRSVHIKGTVELENFCKSRETARFRRMEAKLALHIILDE